MTQRRPPIRPEAEIKDMILMLARGIEARKKVDREHRLHNSCSSSNPNRERMTEREFVRSFGDKVKHVRLSNRADYVGLLLLGKFQGFLITSDDSGERKVRLVDIEDGKWHVTRRALRVKSHDSISNLQRGLLRYVR